MKKRILSGIIIALIGIFSFLLGSIPFKILCGIVSVLGYYEIIKQNNYPKVVSFLGLISLLCLVFMNYDGYALFLGISYQAIALVFLSLLIPTFIFKNYQTNNAFYLSGFTLLLGLVFNSIIMLYEANKWILLYIVIVVCITDIFAYLIGSLIGTKKIAPTISPNKTLEGSIAGILVSIVVGTFYFKAILPNTNLLYIIIMTLLLSVMGEVGDLLFSKIKREKNIKDFSNLIPGHGGILDRLDSLIFAILTYIILYSIL